MKFDKMGKSMFTSVGYAVIVATAMCCKSVKSEPTFFQDFAVLEKTTSYPIPLWENRAAFFSDTMRMCYYKAYVLYDLPNRYANKNGELIFTRMYFLNKTGDPYGYKIDTLTDAPIDPTKKVRTDEYFKEIGYGYEHLAVTDSLRNATPARVGDSVRKYIMERKQPPMATHDTVCLYYSTGLKEFNRSLAPHFDTVPGMTLSKIVINFHLNTVDTANLTSPAKRSIQHHQYRREMGEQYKRRIISYIEQQSKALKD